MIEVVETTTRLKRCHGYHDEHQVQCALADEHFGDHVGAYEDAVMTWPSLESVESAIDAATFEAMSDVEIDAVLETYGISAEEKALLFQRNDVYVRSMCAAQREISNLKIALQEAMRTIEQAVIGRQDDIWCYWESLVEDHG